MIKCKVVIPFRVKADSYIYLDEDRANELEENGFIKKEDIVEKFTTKLYADGKVIETATKEKKIKSGK